MNIDFSLILLLATLATGIIWGLDALLFAKKRLASGEVDEETGKPKEPILVEYSRFLFPVVLIVLLLSLIHISEPTRQNCQSRMPSSA